MNLIEQAYRISTAAVLESQGINADHVRSEAMSHLLAAPPARLPPDYDEDTTADDTAYAWLRRCRESEDAAFDVMTEIEITEHGDFVKKAMHLLSNVGPYSDRNKIINELADALDATLKACATHE